MTLEEAVAMLGEAGKAALGTAINKLDETVAAFDGLLSHPALAQTEAGRALQRVRGQLVVMERSALVAALRDHYGVEAPLPLLDPLGQLLIPPKGLTQVEFMDRVGPFAVGSIMQAAAADPAGPAAIAWEYFRAAKEIQPADLRTVQLIEALVANGVWTRAVADAALSGAPAGSA